MKTLTTRYTSILRSKILPSGFWTTNQPRPGGEGLAWQDRGRRRGGRRLARGGGRR
uniref:Uncharacterized protein n=1 Tax=Oryza brachyantha TaxID=4533 RepID=J3MKW6_ORYBR